MRLLLDQLDTMVSELKGTAEDTEDADITLSVIAFNDVRDLMTVFYDTVNNGHRAYEMPSSTPSLIWLRCVELCAMDPNQHAFQLLQSRFSGNT